MKTYEELVKAFTEYPYSNITVGQLKNIIEYYPAEKIPFSIKEYDSWRGIYAHPYIKPSAAYSSKQQLLDSIDKILTGRFEGWKGGHYRYDEDSLLHFEYGPADFSATEDYSCFLKFIREHKENKFVKFLLENI